MYIIQATNGVETQEMKLKHHTEQQARKKMQDLFDDDYLGLDYYLYDENDNEIMYLGQ